MAEAKKVEGKIIDTTEKVTLYAPTGAKWYKPGQETRVHPTQKDKFLKFGFAETKDAAIANEAHAAIAVEQPKIKGKEAKATPAAATAPVTPDPNAK